MDSSRPPSTSVPKHRSRIILGTLLCLGALLASSGILLHKAPAPLTPAPYTAMDTTTNSVGKEGSLVVVSPEPVVFGAKIKTWTKAHPLWTVLIAVGLVAVIAAVVTTSVLLSLSGEGMADVEEAAQSQDPPPPIKDGSVVQPIDPALQGDQQTLDIGTIVGLSFAAIFVVTAVIGAVVLYCRNSAGICGSTGKRHIYELGATDIVVVERRGVLYCQIPVEYDVSSLQIFHDSGNGNDVSYGEVTTLSSGHVEKKINIYNDKYVNTFTANVASSGGTSTETRFQIDFSAQPPMTAGNSGIEYVYTAPAEWTNDHVSPFH